LATRRFLHDTQDFVEHVKEQMGAEVFMLAGWQDDKGVIKKIK